MIEMLVRDGLHCRDDPNLTGKVNDNGCFMGQQEPKTCFNSRLRVMMPRYSVGVDSEIAGLRCRRPLSRCSSSLFEYARLHGFRLL